MRSNIPRRKQANILDKVSHILYFIQDIKLLQNLKQLTYFKPQTLRWQEVPEPRITSANEALVRPFLVARCDLDAALLRNNIFRIYSLGRILGLVDKTIPRFMRKTPFKGPFPFGHECIAEIMELGKDLTGFKIGQKVVIPFQISCGTCPLCTSGLSSQCEETGSFDMYSGIGKHVSNGGTMSDLLKVPHAQQMLIPIPEGLNLEGLASASDNLPDAWSRVAPHLLHQANKKVLIIGGSAKSIGLYAAGFAVKMKAAQVDYVDVSEERVKIVNTLGAQGIQMDFKKHQGKYDLIVNASNSKRAIQLGVDWLNPGGVLSSANIYFNKQVGVPFFQLYAKNLTLKTGLANPMADIPAMLQFIQATKMQPELVTTFVGNWESADQDLLRDTSKVIIQRKPLKAG